MYSALFLYMHIHCRSFWVRAQAHKVNMGAHAGKCLGTCAERKRKCQAKVETRSWGFLLKSLSEMRPLADLSGAVLCHISRAPMCLTAAYPGHIIFLMILMRGRSCHSVEEASRGGPESSGTAQNKPNVWCLPVTVVGMHESPCFIWTCVCVTAL